MNATKNRENITIMEYLINSKIKIEIYDINFIIINGKNKETFFYKDVKKCLYLKPDSDLLFFILRIFFTENNSIDELYNRIVIYDNKYKIKRVLIKGKFNSEALVSALNLINDGILKYKNEE